MSDQNPPTWKVGPSTPLRSFLRWVGGKRLLAQKLTSFLPGDFSRRRYIEPFLGAASLFFAVQPRRALLSDLNEHLIQCYRFIRDNHIAVASALRRLAAANSRAHYYRVRAVYNGSGFSAAQAARFIYLNRTCFNGVFRVSRAGEFNVPFGDKPNPIFPSLADLAQISRVLKRARLRACDYTTALQWAAHHDFVYLDPPYPPLNGTSFFTHYTPDRFNLAHQEQLARVFRALHRRGSLLMMTNADLPFIRSLYRGFRATPISVPRYVTCKDVKHSVRELVITNYDPGSL